MIQKVDHKTAIEAWAKGVVDGEIVASKWVAMACRRYFWEREELYPWSKGEAKGDPESMPYYFNDDFASATLDLFSEVFTHTKGSKWAGKPFAPSPSQAFILWNVFGWKRSDDDRRRFREVYITVARKWGKALALDTPIRTVGGWSTMGALQIGDQVFDENGDTCNVTNTQSWGPRPCYLVEFSSGDPIIADSEHEWLVKPRHQKERILTTEELSRAVTIQRADGGLERKYRVRVPGALVGTRQELPINPYVLGVWLGDGHSRAARFTCSKADQEMVRLVEACGVVVTRQRTPGATSDNWGLSLPGQKGVPGRSFQSQIKRLGLWGDKHIPELFMNGSYGQRLALMQGLMDTDGHISPNGQCEIVQVKRRLAEDIHELANSLGYKPAMGVDRARLEGRDVGPRYRIRFHAFSDEPCFRLSRKKRKLKHRPSRPPRSRTRQIIAVTRVADRPTKCIEVDSPSHLFLAGKSLIPTHNSTFSAAIALLLLFFDDPPEPEAEGYVAATKEDQAKIVHSQAAKMILACDFMKDQAQLFKRQEKYSAIVLDEPPYNGSFFKPLGSDSDKTDGLNPHFVVKDELHEWREHHRGLKEKLETGGGSREQPLDITITTAGDEQSQLWQEQDELCCRILEGCERKEQLSPTTFAFIARLDESQPCECAGTNEECEHCEGTGEIPGDDPYDEVNWAKANPEIGVSPTWDFMRQQATKAKLDKSFERTFKRYHCNIRVRSRLKIIETSQWANCKGVLSDWNGSAFGGFDLGWRNDLASIAAIFPVDDRYEIRHVSFCPRDGRRDLDVEPWLTWIEQGYLIPTGDDTTDVALVREMILQWASDYGVYEWAYDGNNARQLGTELYNDHGIECEPKSQSQSTYNEPIREFMRLLARRKIVHDGDPLLAWAAGNMVVKANARGEWMPDKESSSEKIDPMCALLMGFGLVVDSDGEGGSSVYEESGSMGW